MTTPIRRWRASLGKGWSQERVAKLAGMPRSTFDTIERGFPCTAENAYRLIAVSNGALTLDDFVTPAVRRQMRGRAAA